MFGGDEKCSAFLSDNIFNLIFIRHGFREDHLIDPRLSKDGVERSKNLSDKLIKKINELWKDAPYVIGSSNMIRTQETAFYMLADKIQKPINIFPHIGEKGMSLDNIGYPKEIQKKIILENNSKIIELLEKGNDERRRQNILNKSSWNDFIEWSVKNLDLFECSSDGVYRAVIFTHSDFLRGNFKLPNDERGNYNSLYHVVFNTKDYKDDLNFDYYEL
jgi:broad specificity phosphatase PhoE